MLTRCTWAHSWLNHQKQLGSWYSEIVFQAFKKPSWAINQPKKPFESQKTRFFEKYDPNLSCLFSWICWYHWGWWSEPDEVVQLLPGPQQGHNHPRPLITKIELNPHSRWCFTKLEVAGEWTILCTLV